MQQRVVFRIGWDDGRGEGWKRDWCISCGRRCGRNNTVRHWVKGKNFAERETHVVVFTEGAR